MAAASEAGARAEPGSEGLVSSAASSRVSVCAAWAAPAAVGWGKAKRRSRCCGSWPEPFPSLLQRRACCRHRCSAAPLSASTAPRYYQGTSRGVAVRGGQGVLPSPGLCVSFSLCDGVTGSVSRRAEQVGDGPPERPPLGPGLAADRQLGSSERRGCAAAAAPGALGFGMTAPSPWGWSCRRAWAQRVLTCPLLSLTRGEQAPS